MMTTARFVPAHAVDRPALLQRLDDALSRRVTLVIAQAGAGKSVLLTQWCASIDAEVSWIDVVDADNDSVYLAKHLLGDLRGEEVSLGTPASTPHGLSASLIDALARTIEQHRTHVVVFDDLHHLRNPQLLANLAEFIERMPENVHVVMTSRSDPGFPTTQLRVRGELGEIRQAALALSLSESDQLVQRIAGVSLTPDALSTLVDRTEGWATGLQLVAMTLRHHPDPDAFVAQFGGSDRLIADYLSEQVLDALPAERRRLILSVAVLDRVSDPLVAAVSTDMTEAVWSLEDLERDSMFLVPIDERREWFRFHPLFRDLLRYRLRAQDATAEQRILADAALWHLQRAELAPAVDYLLRAQRWEQAIELILGRGADVFEQGQVGVVLAWILRIPDAERARHVDLELLLGILLGISGRAEVAEDVLQRTMVSPAASPAQAACAQTFLAALAQWRPHPQVSVDMAVRALDALAVAETGYPDLLRLTDRESLETIAIISGGRAHFLSGDFTEARSWLNRGLATPGAAYSIWRVSALASLALLEAWVGRMPRAEELAEEALGVAQAVAALEHPSTAEAYLALALVADADDDRLRGLDALREGWLRVEANGRAQLAWVFHSVSRLFVVPLSEHEVPPGPPPAVISERLAGPRRGAHRKGWVSARSESAPGRPSGDAGIGTETATLPDPLTERELQILAYLPTRISTAELAERSYVSVNTIKTHLAHIYRKLGVSNRRGAIDRATEVGLLRW